MLGSNVYLVGSGNEKIMIDAGDFNSAGFLDNFGQYLNLNIDSIISKVLITHGHGDHFGGLHDLVKFLKSRGHKQPEVYKMIDHNRHERAVMDRFPNIKYTLS